MHKCWCSAGRLRRSISHRSELTRADPPAREARAGCMVQAATSLGATRQKECSSALHKSATSRGHHLGNCKASVPQRGHIASVYVCCGTTCMPARHSRHLAGHMRVLVLQLGAASGEPIERYASSWSAYSAGSSAQMSGSGGPNGSDRVLGASGVVRIAWSVLIISSAARPCAAANRLAASGARTSRRVTSD